MRLCAHVWYNYYSPVQLIGQEIHTRRLMCCRTQPPFGSPWQRMANMGRRSWNVDTNMFFLSTLSRNHRLKKKSPQAEDAPSGCPRTEPSFDFFARPASKIVKSCRQRRFKTSSLGFNFDTFDKTLQSGHAAST